MEGAWRGRRWLAELGRGRKSSLLSTPPVFGSTLAFSLCSSPPPSFPSFLPSLFLSLSVLSPSAPDCLPVSISPPLCFHFLASPLSLFISLDLSGYLTLSLPPSRGPSLYVSLSPSLCLSDSVSFSHHLTLSLFAALILCFCECVCLSVSLQDKEGCPWWRPSAPAVGLLPRSLPLLLPQTVVLTSQERRA